ncbi:MAG: dTDP-glucose 4,6-dehydratase [Ramlibacter sp.]
MLLVTGGCGFIGSAFILDWFSQCDEPIVNLVLLTYAGHPGNLQTVAHHPGYVFVHGDIADSSLVDALLREHRPRAVVHFAAESHVDRSIHGPEAFIHTNVIGTTRLLQSARAYLEDAPAAARAGFRFLNVSTDEVFGSLEPGEAAFTESHRYQPNSPYSASKAAADQFARAWHHTYGLPVITTNCSNNYGPRQFPEKLIPLMIHNALAGKPLPVYGDGQQVRDWLHVSDHCAALRAVLERGVPGETYNIGGRSERSNLQVVQALCDLLEQERPAPGGRYADLIRFVEDRPGHDRRYAIDDSKIARDLQWKPQMPFETGLRQTIGWYLQNQAWVESVTTGTYRKWIEQQYPAL